MQAEYLAVKEAEAAALAASQPPPPLLGLTCLER